MTDTPSLAVLRLFRASAHLEQRFAPELGSVHGVGLNDLLLLMHLSHAPLQRLRRVDLAARLSVSQSTVTRMTLPLEKTGFVARESDPRDSRVAFVTLTKSGKTLVANAEKTFRRIASDIFRDRWSEKDIATLGELLGRMTSSLPGEIA